MFPPLPSNNNPSIGAADGFASAGAQMYNAIQAAKEQDARLRQQQQVQQSTDMHRALMEHADLLSKGAIPADIITHTPEGFKKRDINPAATGAGQIMTTSDGTRYYIPTETERAKTKADAEAGALNDTNSFTLSDDLAAAAQKAGLTNIKSGVRYPKADLGTLNERLSAYHREIDDQGKKSQMGHITQEASDKFKAMGIDVPVGTEIPLGNLKDALEAVTPKEQKEPTPKSLHFDTSTNDRGDVTITGSDPETGEIKSTSVQKGVGRKRSDDGEREDAINARLNQREVYNDSKNVDVLNQQEQKQHALRRTYGAILSAKDGDLVTLPNGNQVKMNSGVRASVQAKYESATELANTFHEQQVAIIARHTAQPDTAKKTTSSGPGRGGKSDPLGIR